MEDNNLFFKSDTPFQIVDCAGLRCGPAAVRRVLKPGCFRRRGLRTQNRPCFLGNTDVGVLPRHQILDSDALLYPARPMFARKSPGIFAMPGREAEPAGRPAPQGGGKPAERARPASCSAPGLFCQGQCAAELALGLRMKPEAPGQARGKGSSCGGIAGFVFRLHFAEGLLPPPAA